MSGQGELVPTQPPDITPEKCRAWSAAVRRGVINYALKQLEGLLLLILCEETFDRNIVVARVNLERWAGRLGLEPHKLRKLYWEPLLELLIVDFNEGQGTFQIRPFVQEWSRLRGLRVPTNLRAEFELPLVAERQLSDALSSLSQEKVMRESHTVPSGGPEGLTTPAGAQFNFNSTTDNPWEKLRQSLDDRERAEKLPALPPQRAGKSAQPDVATPAPVAQAKKPVRVLTAAPPVAQSAAAYRWLEEIDALKQLGQDERVTRQWQVLCAGDPGYVLGALKRRWAKVQAEARREPVENPLAFLARKAEDDGRLKRFHRQVQRATAD